MEWQTRLYTKMLWDSPEQIVWTNMVMPTELFFMPVDLHLSTRNDRRMDSSLLLSKEYIRVAEERGFHVGLCSYHKSSHWGNGMRGDPTARLAVFPPISATAGTGCFSTSVSGSARRYSSSISPISSKGREPFGSLKDNCGI